MAAPTITLGTPASADTAATTFAVTLPSGTGNKGVIFWIIEAVAGDDLVISATDYTEFGIDVQNTSRRAGVLWRAGTTDTAITMATGGFSSRATWIPFTTDGDVTAIFAGPGGTLASTVNPDPAGLTGMPSGDYRVVALALIADSRGTISAYPTNYADNQADVKAGSANGRPHLAVASRGLTAITAEDPGAFTLSAARNSIGWSFAIPAGGPAPITGTLAETQDAQTVAASGVVTAPATTGTLAETQDPQTLAASGLVSGAVLTGTLAETQGPQTLAASGTYTPALVTGSLAETQGPQTLAASGLAARPVPTGLAANEIGVIGHSNVQTFITYYRTLSGLDLITPINQGGLHAIMWGDPTATDYASAWTKLAEEEPVGGYRAIWLMLGYHPSFIGVYTAVNFEAWADHIAGRLATDYPGVEYIWWSPMNTYFTADHGDGDAFDLLAKDPWGTNPDGIVEHGVNREVSVYSWDTTNYALAQGYADDYGPWINLTAENTDADGRHPSEAALGDPAPNGQTHGGDILFEFFDGSAIVGTLAETQDAQTLAATGRVSIVGSLAETQDAQTLAADGLVSPPVVTGSLAETQGPQTLAATGAFIGQDVVSGSVSEVQGPQTLAAAGTVTSPTITGSLAETQGAQTSSASGTSTPPSFTGSLSETQDSQTLVAVGSVGVSGALAEIQGEQVLAASGTFTPLSITGSLAETQGPQTLAASGSLATTGSGREQSGSIRVTQQTGQLVTTGRQE